MATQVQFRRGTTSQNNAFTGAIGELTYDTEAKTLRLHDGSTAGGGAVVAILAGTQTFTNKTLSTNCSWQGNAVGLSYGGTNANITAAAGAVVYSTSSALGVSAAGTSGQVLTSGGTSAPTWVSQSSLTVGNATVASRATNIDGGSPGYLVYQVDTNDTGFIPPGTSGQVLRSTGASTAPDWVNGNVILGSTTLSLGSTTTTVSGLNILASTGTSHWTIPAGNTSQRPVSPAAGMIRYNSQISSFEGYGPGNAWGSLGGVKDVDGDTYILTETSAGSDEDTFSFYNAGSVTATLSGSLLDIKSAVQVEINNVTDSSSVTSGALVVDGGVGIAKKLYVGTDANIAGTTTLGNLTIGSSKTVSMGSNKITNVATPTSSTDAANKQYVDEVAQGILAKPAVEIATTANLTATYSNGTSGVGATLTATSNGAFPEIDGITLSSTTIGENGILVKNQSTAAQNGRYNLTQVGDAGTPWILTRCGLCDEADEIPGAYVFVKRGTLYAGTGWVQTVADPATFTVGTDAIIVTQFSGAGTYTAGTGLVLNGTQFELGTSGVSANTYGSSTAIPVLTVDTYGRITSATTSSITVGNGTLSLAVSGTGLSGSASFTANQSGNSTFTVTSNATSENTGSTIVARDSNGDFTAGTVTAVDGFIATSANPFVYSATTVSANVTIPSNYNAMAAGPITVNNGVTITIPDGSTLTIV